MAIHVLGPVLGAVDSKANEPIPALWVFSPSGKSDVWYIRATNAPMGTGKHKGRRDGFWRGQFC